MNKITDYRQQITEIYQISDIRQTGESQVCQMIPTKFLSNATCYLINNSKGGV